MTRSEITGEFGGNVEFGPYQFSPISATGALFYVARVSPAGKFTWAWAPQKLTHPYERSEGRAVAVAPSGHVLTAGYNVPGVTIDNIKLLRKGTVFIWKAMPP